jgi:hypothetical protein
VPLTQARLHVRPALALVGYAQGINVTSKLGGIGNMLTTATQRE